ncbi:MAG: anhydro-N-acetylmuramic acid kinase [Pseudomonadota bacterium]
MAAGDPVWAVGLMTGTSMDGIDAAALLTDGVEVRGFGPKRFTPFAEDLAAGLRGAQGLWPGAAGLEELSAALDAAHADALTYFPTTELVGYHGQTLAHDPAGQRSHQLGDGAALARSAGKPVVWDFRSADLASGGEGAPLAPFFHHACARLLGLEGPVVFVNVGGVANVTWVDPLMKRPEASGALMAFDTGPGNAPLDDLCVRRGLGAMDRGGALGLGGRADPAVIARALNDPFIDRAPPKSLDRNAFAWLEEAVAGLPDADAAATLAATSAALIGAAARHFPDRPARWLVCGGGRHNVALMRQIAAQTNAPVEPVESVGLDGDFLEAQAFAYLAVRVANDLPTSAPTTTGARLPVSGGRISG